MKTILMQRLISIVLLLNAVESANINCKRKHLSQFSHHLERSHSQNSTFATLGQFPFYAVLLNTKQHVFCGGSIITDTHILTAAHCFFDEINGEKLENENMIVLLGTTDISTYEVIEDKYFVNNAFEHPDYNPDYGNNDIGIVELLEPIKFTGNIQPIPLSTILVKDAPLIAVGFGKMGNNILNIQYRELPSVQPSECFPIEEDAICIYTTLTNPCDGVAGGPVVFVSKMQQFIQIGITSNIGNNQDCPNSHYFSFRPVANYGPWIKNIIGK